MHALKVPRNFRNAVLRLLFGVVFVVWYFVVSKCELLVHGRVVMETDDVILGVGLVEVLDAEEIHC